MGIEISVLTQDRCEDPCITIPTRKTRFLPSLEHKLLIFS